MDQAVLQTLLRNRQKPVIQLKRKRPIARFPFAIGLALIVVSLTSCWQPASDSESGDDSRSEKDKLPAAVFRLGEQQAAQLQPDPRPFEPGSHWRTIQVNGRVVSRPGITKLRVAAPVDGIVAKVYADPGDTLRPGDRLVRLRIASDEVEQAQSDFFQAARDWNILQRKIRRLQESGSDSVRTLELAQQDIVRATAEIESLTSKLLESGLSEDQLDKIKGGEFVKTITIRAPAEKLLLPEPPANEDREEQTRNNGGRNSDQEEAPERITLPVPELLTVRKLNASLGQPVAADKALVELENNRDLLVKGRVERNDTLAVIRSAKSAAPVDIVAASGDQEWGDLDQEFQIGQWKKSGGRKDRRVDFFVPLTNEVRSYTSGGNLFVTWRFRLGQQVAITVPAEELRNVFAIPNSGVANVGEHTCVFRNAADRWERVVVTVVARDSFHTFFANDGSIQPGDLLATRSAAELADFAE